MKKIIIITISILITTLSFSQNLIEAEYFWDTDPGEGSGITLLALDGNFNSALETVFSNNVSLPAIGNHIFGVRVKGYDGNWSPVYRRVFKISGNNNSNLTAKVTQAEYFWDTDPGEGSGTTLLALDGNFNSALEAVFSNNASLPAIGNHIFGVRVKGDDGNWSPIYKRVFKISGNNNSNLTAKVTQAEYFWDTDPGEGSGTTLLALDGNFNSALETVFFNNAALPVIGNHVFGVRVKGDDGNWGVVYKRIFKISGNNNSNLTAKVTQAEYFWDTDPGEGSGTALLALDGSFNSAIEELTNTTSVSLSKGLHLFNVRVKGDDGNWGEVYRKVVGVDISYDKTFLVSPTNLAVNVNLIDTLKWESVLGIGQYEYQYAVDSFFSVGLISGMVNDTVKEINGLSYNATYYWKVRANDGVNVGLWSDVWKFTTLGCSSIIDTISPSICMGDSVSFNGVYYNSTGTYKDTFHTSLGCDSIKVLILTVNIPTYAVLHDSICEGNQYNFNGNFLTDTGVYYDTLNNSNGCDSLQTLYLRFYNKPVITISQVVFDLETQPGYTTYKWLKNGIVITGETSFTITPNQNANYSVIAFTQYGCSDTASFVWGTTTIQSERTNNMRVTVFPNPSSGIFTIKSSKPMQEIVVYDASQRIILRELNIGNIQMIDLSQFRNGMYILETKTNRGKHEIKRIIKTDFK
jgi:hypothetical protein